LKPNDSGLGSGPIEFDTKSGFSIEEQQEILDKINSLSVEKGIVPQADFLNDQLKKEVKKKDIHFPLLVNIGALLLLVGGFFLLWSFHDRNEQEIRRGSAVLSLTEQKLIQEIRQETARQLNEKEREINDIRSLLASAEAEYRQLQLSLVNLSDEQRERAVYLLNLQWEYQETLSRLQKDQSQLLLSMLSSEQDRAAAVEAQLGGYYAMVDQSIRDGEIDEAAIILMNMREFLNSPLFLNNRSVESSRQIHLTAVAAMQEMVGEVLRVKESSPGGAAQTAAEQALTAAQDEALAELEARYAALEQRAADQERTIAAFSSQGSEQSRIISEFESTISGLRSENIGKDRQIADLNNNVISLGSQLQTANTRVSSTELTLEGQRRQNTELTQENATLTRSNNELTNQNTDLQNQVNDLQRRIDSLRALLE
jgi:chromosome segregation ATPase